MEVVGNAKEVLTRKIGPLPAIAWGVILGGMFVGYRYYKASKEPIAPPPVVGVDPTLGGAVGDVGGADDFSTGYGNATGDFGGSIIPGSTTTTTTPETAIQTNLDWGRRAVTVLIAEGYNPLDASTAISSYLYTGMQLNSQQSAMLAIAIQKLGPPPEGVLAPPEQSEPTPTPTPTPQPTPAPPTPAPAPTPAPVTPTPFSMPGWLTGVKFVKGSGPAVYAVTAAGLEWIPSESAFYAMGGGGSFAIPGGGTHTYAGNPGGIPPIIIPDGVLAALPKVGQVPG